MIQNPTLILDKDRKEELNIMVEDQSFSGHGWSDNYFIRPKDVLPFFERFDLRKLHLVNCERFLYMRETELLKQAPEVIAAWLDLAEKVCEREEFLSLAEHIIYIGRKE